MGQGFVVYFKYACLNNNLFFRIPLFFKIIFRSFQAVDTELYIYNDMHCFHCCFIDYHK